MEQKIEILAKLDKGQTVVSLARLYNIGKATVTNIKYNCHAIVDFASKMDSGDGIKRRKVMKVAKYQDLDKAMEMWFIQKRSLNEPISRPLICEKALEMNTKCIGTEDFKVTGFINSNLDMEYVSCKFNLNYYQLIQVALKILNKTLIQLFVEKEVYSQNSVYNAD